MKKVKILYEGEECTGTQVPFQPVEEKWNIYEAEDGSTVRMRTIVSEIIRLDAYKEDGEPLYVVRSHNVVATEVPEELMKRPDDRSH